jgi:hypothetical protein
VLHPDIPPIFLQDIFLETLNEQKPQKRRDNSEDFLTRCVLSLRPHEGQQSPEKNLQFRIVHPLVRPFGQCGS